eukprot:TRINITY_DN713_c1_g1_i1.p1 TRINITY_DN713_c1_g1~~TRINITY_DN713_c1_g1_i1.p1  ORF type:complete len:65 (+),score=6.36 TRINITY_DN713_c1_g1_i1:89-283(+)
MEKIREDIPLQYCLVLAKCCLFAKVKQFLPGCSRGSHRVFTLSNAKLHETAKFLQTEMLQKLFK